MTGNYAFAMDWAAEGFADQLRDKYLVLIDALDSYLTGPADVVLPAATWAEKAGTFENAKGMLQAFEQAIPTQHESKSEGQIAADLSAMLGGKSFERPRTTAADAVIDEGPGQVPAGADVAAMPRAALFNAANTRQSMAQAYPKLGVFVSEVSLPKAGLKSKPDVEVVEL
jgi:anaerobic selenocysteine-containing dehydrogenase